MSTPRSGGTRTAVPRRQKLTVRLPPELYAATQEAAGDRAVLVLSAEPLAERYDVVMVAPVTNRKRGRPARLGEVLLPAGTAGLAHDSFAICYQVRALDKSRLGRLYGEVSDPRL